MKQINVSQLYLFLISAGEELVKINAVGQCEEGLYHGKGGSCKDKPCMRACQQKHGSEALGICFFFSEPNDTCRCRYPC